MNTICSYGKCTGCHACVDTCPCDAINIIDDCFSFTAQIDESKCIKCNRCSSICPNNQPVAKMKPLEWYEGWANLDYIRNSSSSGGFAAAIANSFINDGGHCYACVLFDDDYVYKRIYSVSEMQGSKYVKSNPSGIYKEIEQDLSDGCSVLFIGLPCHVAGIKKVFNNNHNLFTIDLICHGSPSVRLLKSFLMQYDVKLSDLNDLKFRKKQDEHTFGYHKFSTKGIEDYYIFSYLKGLIFTECCYECTYAQTNRVSDITLGDSWGSDLLSESECVSLALCNTEAGQYLINKSDLFLSEPDISVAIKHNKQLNGPFKRPVQRDIFICNFEKGLTYNRCVRKCYSRIWFKQDIKKVLIHLGLYRPKELSFKLFYKNNGD